MSQRLHGTYLTQKSYSLFDLKFKFPGYSVSYLTSIFLMNETKLVSSLPLEVICCSVPWSTPPYWEPLLLRLL